MLLDDIIQNIINEYPSCDEEYIRHTLKILSYDISDIPHGWILLNV